jgi:hypothetical protein
LSSKKKTDGKEYDHYSLLKTIEDNVSWYYFLYIYYNEEDITNYYT